MYHYFHYIFAATTLRTRNAYISCSAKVNLVEPLAANSSDSNSQIRLDPRATHRNAIVRILFAPARSLRIVTEHRFIILVQDKITPGRPGRTSLASRDIDVTSLEITAFHHYLALALFIDRDCWHCYEITRARIKYVHTLYRT